MTPICFQGGIRAHRRVLLGWLCLVGVLAVLLGCASVASAARGHVFERTFAEPCVTEPCVGGQLKEPDGVAVNEASGDVFVVDKAANRLVRFNAAGTFLSEVTGPNATGMGTLTSGSERIESAAAATGAFSVGEEISAPGLEAGTVITAVNGGGILEVSPAATKSELASLSAKQRFETPETVALDNSCALRKQTEEELTLEACQVEDPSNEDVYVVDAGRQVVDKFSATGEYLGQITQASIGLEKQLLEGVAVDKGGAVWLYRHEKNAVVDRFSNAVANEFVPPQIQLEPKLNGEFVFAMPGFAIDSKGDFYGRVGVGHHPRIDKFSTTGVLLVEDIDKEDASAVSVEQGSDVAFVDNLSTIAAFSAEGGLVERLGEEGGVKHLVRGAGVGVSVSAGSLYVADAVAGRVVVFGPAPASTPRVEGESFSGVSSTDASLQAQINPRSEVGEAASEYSFQYGRCASATSCGESYEASVPVPTGRIAAGFEVQSVTVALTGLTPNSTYHFRVLASNAHGQAQPGEGMSFTTEGVGGELKLLDDRGWEMVSPPEKQGALIEPLPESGVVQAAADGSGITYFAQSPTERGPEGYANHVQVLSSRGGSSWSSRDLAIAHASAAGFPVGAGPEYRFFDPDLQLGVVQPFGEFVSFSAEASEQTPYLRELGAGCGSHCFHPLVTGEPGFANVPEGTRFGENELCEPKVKSFTELYCGPEFVGASEDLHHVVLEAKTPLIHGAGALGLYEWNEGALSQVNVLPDGEPAAGAGLGFEGGNSVRGAISRDGTRVVWGTGKELLASLYLRDMQSGKTVQLDAAGCGSCESGGGQFQIANSEGSRVYFTDEAKLTEDSGAERLEPDLYECQIVETAGQPACDLTDVTPVRSGESAVVLGGVLGASEDGSYIYFVAKGVLSEVPNARGLSAIAGQPNVYLRHDGMTSFIATLTSADEHDWQTNLGRQPTRVSSSGRWLELMSEAALTGYDNRDRVTGRRVAEVYLFDAVTGRLSCASCVPSGERPIGVEYEKISDGGGGVAGGESLWPERSLVAANVAGSDVIGGTKARYQPRYLSNEGRLFFNSFDRLVPQDSNGTEDVYEFEPAGVGDCGVGSESFSAGAEGCVGLISSGASTQESAFLDASESGDDVFFLTAARLSRLDDDSAFDVYDAHVCTSALPCIAFPDTQSPPCTNEASCKAAPTPQPSIFGAPASATFAGPDNPAPVAQSVPVKSKIVARPKSAARVRAEKLAKALKACRVRRDKRKRAVCEQLARRRYRGRIAGKTNNGRRNG